MNDPHAAAQEILDTTIRAFAARLLRGDDSLAVLTWCRDYFISLGFKPREAANIARGISITLADQSKLRPDYVAGVHAELTSARASLG
jgi:hypothetical protein